MAAPMKDNIEYTNTHIKKLSLNTVKVAINHPAKVIPTTIYNFFMNICPMIPNKNDMSGKRNSAITNSIHSAPFIFRAQYFKMRKNESFHDTRMVYILVCFL